MLLKTISLQNFRNHTKAAFTFSPDTTYVVGPNTAGKSNLIEAITLIATGKSFRSDKEKELIAFGASHGRISGEVDDMQLAVVLTNDAEGYASRKRYLVNTIPRRRVDFASHLPIVLFSPLDLDIVIGSPGVRRRFLDFVLEQTDKVYRTSSIAYEKALRQRNALLERTRETGIRNQQQFNYWDDLVIQHGSILTEKRDAYIIFLNQAKKDVFHLTAGYDKSTISKERLLQYKDAEVSAGVTLVGPHRDDVRFFLSVGKEEIEIKSFGSRGQQRLAVLQLKLLQIVAMEEVFGVRPLLLLDDVFSELDQGHIQLVMDMIGRQQTIITTTHKEFVGGNVTKSTHVIELGKL